MRSSSIIPASSPICAFLAMGIYSKPPGISLSASLSGFRSDLLTVREPPSDFLAAPSVGCLLGEEEGGGVLLPPFFGDLSFLVLAEKQTMVESKSRELVPK